MAEKGKEVQKLDERSVEFVPFGSKDIIKLNTSIVRNFVANPTRSGKVPDDRQCIKFVMLCKAKKLNPFEGDAFLIGFDGKDGPEFSLVTAHQAFLKRAETNPEYDGMDSGVTVTAEDEPYVTDDNKVRVIRKTKTGYTYERPGDIVYPDEKLVGAWARVDFKSRKTSMYKAIALEAFDKGRSLWSSNKSGMLVKCAEADALRSSFPTLLGGLYLEHEMRSGLAPDSADAVPQSATAALNEALNKAKPEPEPAIIDAEAEIVSE
jgi:phage recombination protein Bet